MPVTHYPLANSAIATSAAESKYRIDYPLAPARSPRVVALDAGAELMVARVAAQPWDSAAFYTAVDAEDGERVMLRGIGGGEVPLEELIVDIDAMILVATQDSGAKVAQRIAEACAIRAIMVAGIVIGSGDLLETVTGLRPFARTLLVSYEEHDIDALLIAIRA